MKRFVLTAGLALVLAAAASAQILSGSLSGSVVDPTGQSIPGATVKLMSEVDGEERSAATNETGDFLFPGLSPGAYTIRIEARGFKGLERKNNVVLAAGRLAVGALQLDVGSLTESVTVTAQGQEVATTTTAHQAVLDTKQISMISLRGRDVVSMLRILPGVQQGIDSDALGGSYGTSVPQFQGRGGSTIYVDGVNGGSSGSSDQFAAPTNLDAIGEVNVQMGAYTAEYGLKGGTQVNIITKRGSDQYHGTAYWYIKNEAFNANNWLNNQKGLPRVMSRVSNQGGTLGGRVPAKIPILNPKGHQMFFFYSLDDTRMKEPTALRQWTLPSMLERKGDFSQSRSTSGSLITVRDPLNGNAPFSGNVIPSSRQDPASVAMMNIFPTPNAQGQVGYNFYIQEPSIDHPKRQQVYRIDLRPTDNDTISIKHSTWMNNSTGIEVAGRASTWGAARQIYDFATDTANLSYTKIIGPRLVNEFSLGLFYSTENGPPADQAAWDGLSKKTYPAIAALKQFAPQNNPYNLIPWIMVGSVPNGSFEGRGGPGRSALLWFDPRTPNIGADTALAGSNNLTYMRSTHTFKMGVQRETERFAQARAGTFAGQFDFSNDSNDPGTTGYAFSNMFVGHVKQYSESLGRTPNNRVQTIWAWFVQDTWKVHRRLTLDIGVRMYKLGQIINGGGESSEFTFERFDPKWGGKPPVLFQPVSTAQGRRAQNPLTNEVLPASYIGMMVPGTGYSCNAALTPQSPCLFNGIVVQNDTTYVKARGFNEPFPVQWDPRFGLAWDPFGKGRMAIRASFGAYHDGTGGILYEGGPAFNFTKSVLFTDMNSYMSGSSATTPISVTGGWRLGAKRPVTYNYTLAVQRDLGWHTVLDVAYVGSTTHHNSQSWNFNALPSGVRFLASSQDPTSPGKPLPDVFLRPIAGFGDISISGPATTSRYDSLQVQSNRRFVGGVELAGTFTYAGGTSNGWNQNNPLPSSMARTRNNALQQLVFNLSYVIDLPRGTRLTKAPGAKWVLDDWQFSGVTTFANGQLSDVGLSTSDSFDFSGGGESCGIVQLGDAKLARGQRTADQWFNTSVFRRPSGRGDLGNNCNNAKFRLPGFNNHDLSLFKNFPIREDKKLQFRWELYNALNHTQYSTVNATASFNPQGVSSANFGKVTGARAERRMQLSLRFTF